MEKGILQKGILRTKRLEKQNKKEKKAEKSIRECAERRKEICIVLYNFYDNRNIFQCARFFFSLPS